VLEDEKVLRFEADVFLSKRESSSLKILLEIRH